MAIQMRRGLRADFDPTKMLPGEWAVAIDSDTANQIVWMCFAPGIVKRIGAYEDFYALIEAEYSEYIPDVICDVEQTGNATKPYTVGDYVITGGKMYVVTANIPNGGTFTPGTNVDQTTVGAVLKALSTGKQDTLTFDNVPTQGSNNPVKSGGVYTAIQASGKVDTVNNIQPDANKNVSLAAEDIPADGIGDKTVEGNPIEVNDAIASVARDLDVNIEPIQDLHGYDHPWSPGGGKNIVNVADQIGLTGNTLLASNLPDNVTLTASADVTDVVGTNGRARIRLQYDLDGETVYSENVQIVSGRSIATLVIPSGATNVAVYSQRNGSATSYSLKNIMVEYGETAHDYEPYSNICPISGMSEVNVTRAGKNLLQPFARTSGIINRGQNGEIVINGTSSSTTWLETIVTGVEHCIYLKAGTYSLTGGISSDIQLYGVFSYDNFVTRTEVPHDTGNGCRFTMVSDGKFYLQCQVSAGTYDNQIVKPQLELGSTATTYEPYHGQSVTIALGDTIYGGTLDVNTGVLTVTHGYREYSGDWLMASNGVAYIDNTATDGRLGTVLCNQYEYGGTAGGTADALLQPKKILVQQMQVQGINGLRFMVYNPDYATADAWNTFLASNPLQVVYRLQTPTTVQLTPAQLEMIEGYNYIYTDAKSLGLTYLGSEASNVQAEIDEFERVTNNLKANMATVEDTDTASKNYVVGEHMVFKNIYSIVTSAITEGQTIAFGQNIMAVPIGSEIEELSKIDYTTTTLNGVTFEYYENKYGITILATAENAEIVSGVTAFDLRAKTELPSMNIVEPLSPWALGAIKGRIYLNAGRVKFDVTSTGYLQGKLEIPKR